MYSRTIGEAVLALLLAMVSAAANAQSVPGQRDAEPQAAEERQAAKEEADARQAAAGDRVAIPPEQLPERTERAQEFLRRAAAIAQPIPIAESISAQLPVQSARIDALTARAVASNLAARGPRELGNLRQQTADLRQILVDWQQRLSKRLETLTTSRRAVARELNVWRLTSQAARAQRLPGELRQNIAGVVASLTDVDRRLRQRQDEVLAVQAQVSARLGSVDDIVARTDEALAATRGRLFSRDYPPLWRGLTRDGTAVGFPSIVDRLLEEGQILAEFLEAQPGRAWLHGLGFAGLLVLFGLFHRRVKQWIAEDASLQRPLAPFRHPVAAAVVLGLFITPWVYDNSPLILREVSTVLAVVPVVRVLHALVPASMRLPLYALAVFYLLVRLGALVAAGTATDRVILLVYTLATAGILWWIFRRGGPGQRVEAGRWWRGACTAARGALLLLLLSVVLNVLGFVALAELLTRGVLSAAFLAVLLLAATLVLQGAAFALLMTGPARRVNMVRWHGATLRQWTLRLLGMAAVASWFVGTLFAFQLFEPARSVVRTALFSSVSVGTVEISLSDVLAFGVAVYVGLLVARLIRFVLTVDVYPRIVLPRGVPATVSMLVTYTVVGMAFVFAVAAAGIQLENFAIIAGALSVGIGFGLQNVVNNFVSGLILAFERPVQAGDTVEVGQTLGRVTRIGVRSSTVRTWDGAEVIVPNGNLISNEVTNWTLSDRQRRMEILAGVAYGTNPRKVVKLLRDTARSDDRLLAAPEPMALFLGFGASSLDFSLRAWTDDFDNYLTIKSDLTLAVHDAIVAAGIEIPFPQSDLHLRSVDERAGLRLAPRGDQPGGGAGSASSGGVSASASGAGAGSADPGSGISRSGSGAGAGGAGSASSGGAGSSGDARSSGDSTPDGATRGRES